MQEIRWVRRVGSITNFEVKGVCFSMTETDRIVAPVPARLPAFSRHWSEPVFTFSGYKGIENEQALDKC